MFKKNLEKLKKGIGETIDSGKEAVDSSVKKVTETKNEITEGISNVSNTVTTKVSKTVDSVTETVDSVVETVDNVATTATVVTKKLYNGVETVVATVKIVGDKLVKTVNWVLGFSIFILEAGLTIAAVTSPVPTLIGIAILFIMGKFISDIADEVEDTKTQKKTKKAIETLKKYGAIPKNAIVKTDLVEMNIDSEAGTVSGKILKGDFKNASLESLSISEIENLAHYAPEEKTKELLEAYLSFRKKKEENNIEIVNS
ncbi:MAG: hypothetical protein CL760_11350 [Chloroflexi bacterium]|nr:hypothetical protein [Chloroflexota bacterium]